MRAGLWFAAALPLVTACGGDEPRTPTSPTSPTPPAASVVAPPAPDSAIRGLVQDTAARPLVGARVESLDGPSAGAFAVVGADGFFNYTGAYTLSTRFRATHDGHESIVDTPRCSIANCANNARPWMLFSLRPLAAPVDLAGDYTLTLAAAARCVVLPADALSRSYPVTITPRFRENTADQLGFTIEIRSASVLESMRRLSMGVAADYISLYIVAGEGEDPALVEDLGSNRYVTFAGWSTATLNRASLSNIDLTFDGSIDVVTLRSPLGAVYRPLPADVISKEQCASKEHRLMLTRTR